MKKTFILLAAVILACTTNAHAQKYGHINAQEVTMQMPGIDSLQIKLAAFERELQEAGNLMVQEYQNKKDQLDKQAGTMSAAVRQMREKELIDLQNRIMEFQETAQQDMENKQLELQQPFLERINKAIEDVAKENGYTYIFDTRTLLYTGGGDDVTALVKKKLGINK